MQSYPPTVKTAQYPSLQAASTQLRLVPDSHSITVHHI
jgi:hypothetical protein